MQEAKLYNIVETVREFTYLCATVNARGCLIAAETDRTKLCVLILWNVAIYYIERGFL